MDPKRILPVLFLSLLLTAPAFAQTAADPTEFGRFSEGTLEMVAKRSGNWSGSLGVTAGQSQMPFGNSGTGKRYDATFGGTLVKDRAWFFASGERSSISSAVPNFNGTALVDPSLRLGMSGVTDKQSLNANFSSGTLPKSFLNLHYTGVITSNSFFTANVSSTK